VSAVKGLAGKLAGKSKDEKIAALEAEYDDLRPELDEIIRVLAVVNNAMTQIGMPAGKVWATIVVSAADAMDLDLDTPEGLGTAAMLAAMHQRLT
jgi:hypothetical protein